MIRNSSKLLKAVTLRSSCGYLSSFAPHIGASQAVPVSSAGFAAKTQKTKAAPKSKIYQELETPVKRAAKTQTTDKIFVTGCSGQIGKALLPALCDKYGAKNVLASDVVQPKFSMENDFKKLDVANKKKFSTMIEAYKPTKIIHLAAILSATAQANPQLALDVNLGGFQNALNAAHKLGALLYCPSTLAVYGPDAPKTKTPLHTSLRPTSIYGITKVENELLGGYYKDKYGVDYRSLRYVGIMSSEELPMHGTTDYSTGKKKQIVDIIIKALQGKKSYQVYLKKDRKLPMMYIDEAIDATLMYIEAPLNKLSSHVYNLNGACVAPQDFAKELQKKFPGFKVTYKPDFRDAIAQSWPTSINDALCTKDWGWSTKITAAKLVKQVIDGYKGNQADNSGEEKKSSPRAKKASATKKATTAKKTTTTTKATEKKTTAKATTGKRGRPAAASKAEPPASTGKRGRPASTGKTAKPASTGKRGRPASTGAKTTRGKKAKA